MKPLNLEPDATWKQRFRAPVVPISLIAQQNPKRGLVISNRSGIYQLYAWDVPTGELRQLTDDPTGVVYGGISPDGEYVYYLEDEGGNEIGHYARIPFDGTPDTPSEDITPEMPLYSSLSISQSLNGRVLGFSAAGEDGFEMYTVTKEGQPQLLYRSERMSFGPILSYDGDYGVIATTERSENLDFSLMAFHIGAADDDRVLVLQDEDASIQPTTFAPLPGDTRLLGTTNASGFDRPVVWDVKTGDRIDIPLQDIEGNITPWGWSPDGTKLLLNRLYQAEYQLYVYDLEHSTLNKLDHPSGTYNSGYFIPGSDEIFVNYQDATQPSRVIALDAKTGQMKRVVLAAGDAPAGLPWRSVSFASSGGAQIQAWVATPGGEGPFPMILHTHGGPTAVTTNSFSPTAQTWLDHGFAFMSVNYRGSVTFGRDFERAIWGILGHREVDDMAAAYQWAVDNGVAQPDAVLLTGGSYGGYLTLQALGRRPDLWAGGMASVAIADWKLMYEDQADTLRGYQRSLFGGTPEELPEQHRASSPITYAEAINAPVLVIQGRNDTRCPSRQMEVYEKRLQENDKDIHVHWFDAGHGSRANEQNIEHMELMLRFAYRVLG